MCNPQHVFVSPSGTKFYEGTGSAREMAAWTTFSHLEWPAYDWPGGYPLFYITEDCGVLCPKCANDNLELTLDGDAQWKIVAQDVNYEDANLFCDHCGERIAPAYGED